MTRLEVFKYQSLFSPPNSIATQLKALRNAKFLLSYAREAVSRPCSSADVLEPVAAIGVAVGL